ncbi:MAG TPA: hypothetical protein VFJ82_13330 [Longimicrobium sp.]|nr:hypothetical protein [Longimicrobium sp.]
MKSSPGRVAAVTAGLMLAGGLFGGAAAAAGAAIALSITPVGLYGGMAVTVATLIGGALGAPLLPATSWLLLRRVPLGLSWLGTTLGAVVGGLAGWFAALAMQGDPVTWPILAALAGFFTAVIVLRTKFSVPREGRRVGV